MNLFNPINSNPPEESMNEMVPPINANPTEEEEAWRKEYDAQERRYKRRVWREKDSMGHFVAGYAFGEEVAEGGWATTDGKLANWMTKQDLIAAERRAAGRCYATGLREAKYPDFIVAQCGGCKFFAALNDDWGICCGPDSPNDGRMVFEHGGCAAHSLASQYPDAVDEQTMAEMRP